MRLSSVMAVTLLVVSSGMLPACGSNTLSPSPGAGFTKTDLKTGSGAEAVAHSVVTVNYTGWLYDPSKTDNKGLQFDTSAGRGPLTFNLGTGTVILGWDEGLLGMKVGGVRRLVIPPSMAYGGVRAGAIPPYSTLVFDVELLGVE